MNLSSAPVLAVVAAALVAGCGSSSDSSGSGAGAGGGGGYGGGSTPAATAKAKPAAAASTGGTLGLTAGEQAGLSFAPKALTAKAGSVTLKLANPGANAMPHAIAIEGHGVAEVGAIAQPGGSSSVTAKLAPGTYTFYCPVGSHRANGMEGKLTVS
jgi:plastocyanin